MLLCHSVWNAGGLGRDGGISAQQRRAALGDLPGCECGASVCADEECEGKSSTDADVECAVVECAEPHQRNPDGRRAGVAGVWRAVCGRQWAESGGGGAVQLLSAAEASTRWEQCVTFGYGLGYQNSVLIGELWKGCEREGRWP